MVDNHLIRASFGTTKYCTNFIQNISCTNQNCSFIHEIAENNITLDKNNMATNKSIYISQHEIAIKIANIFDEEVRRKIMGMKNLQTIFTSPHFIYQKEYIINYEEKIKTRKKTNFNEKYEK